jgi:multidrug efflux pump subunit AcrA (membrane-fusion protein)
LFLVPSGSKVKKGDRLCELDSAALRDQLINQRITIESAKANQGNAQIAAEDAALLAKAYRDDLFPREQRELEGATKIAEAELALAEAEHKAIEAARMDNPLGLMRADLARTRARFALEKAKNRLHILVGYTKGQRTRELARTAQVTRSTELAKTAIVELEISKEKKLERQIAACAITAPIDGTVVYADRMQPGAQASGGLGPDEIAAGAMVRERQLILWVVPAPIADGEREPVGQRERAD